MTSKLSLAAFASLGLMVAGCLGGYEPAMTGQPGEPAAPADPPATPPDNPPPFTPPPGATPPPVVVPSNEKPNFIATVQPILAAGCAGAGCHTAPGASPIRFLPVNAADTYDAVLAFSDKLVANTFDKTKAQIVLKVTPGHYTATYTPAQIAAINAWLDGEVVARAAGGVAPPNERVKLMAEWSGCMTLTDWAAEGVAVAWADKGTNEGDCRQCHQQAQGWLATRESTRAFDILTKSENPKTGGRFMEYYFVPDLTNPAAPKMIINRGMLVRAAGGNAQHPTFNVDGDAMQRLTRFYDKTLAKQVAKTCAPPAFTP